MAEKRYDAFLSFADEDRILADSLRRLLEAASLVPYFAPEILGRAGSPNWKIAIRSAIQDSRSLVRIITRNSLRRPWVLYELGAADMLGIPEFPARVSGVSISELAGLPGDDMFVFDLFNPKGLCDLVLRIYREARGATAAQRHGSMIRNTVQKAVEADEILAAAAVRWVFLAGSAPTDTTALMRFAADGQSAAPSSDRILEMIATDLTQALLTAGFSVGSCPEVPAVGSAVAREATRWICEHTQGAIDRYQIGGLYPIDREARRRELTLQQRDHWNRLFMEYRRGYLRRYEWLLVLGGNEGTHEEFEAALSLESVKICSIPAIGGTGLRIYDRLRDRYPFPLAPGDCVWNETARSQLVEHLGRWP